MVFEKKKKTTPPNNKKREREKKNRVGAFRGRRFRRTEESGSEGRSLFQKPEKRGQGGGGRKTFSVQDGVELLPR